MSSRGGREGDASSRTSASSIDARLLSMGLSSTLAWLAVVSVSMTRTRKIAHVELSDALQVLLFSSAAVSPCWRQGEEKARHSIGTGSKEGLVLGGAGVTTPATVALLLRLLLLLMLMVLLLVLVVLPLVSVGRTPAPCGWGGDNGGPSSSSCSRKSKVFMLIRVHAFVESINDSNPYIQLAGQ